MLQDTCVISILKLAIVVCEGSSKLNVFSRSLPISLFDMFLMVEGGSKI
jgi:hypothetical protein